MAHDPAIGGGSVDRLRRDLQRHAFRPRRQTVGGCDRVQAELVLLLPVQSGEQDAATRIARPALLRATAQPIHLQARDRSAIALAHEFKFEVDGSGARRDLPRRIEMDLRDAPGLQHHLPALRFHATDHEDDVDGPRRERRERLAIRNGNRLFAEGVEQPRRIRLLQPLPDGGRRRCRSPPQQDAGIVHDDMRTHARADDRWDGRRHRAGREVDQVELERIFAARLQGVAIRPGQTHRSDLHAAVGLHARRRGDPARRNREVAVAHRIRRGPRVTIGHGARGLIGRHIAQADAHGRGNGTRLARRQQQELDEHGRRCRGHRNGARGWRQVACPSCVAPLMGPHAPAEQDEHRDARPGQAPGALHQSVSALEYSCR